jgi:hypothetical protein
MLFLPSTSQQHYQKFKYDIFSSGDRVRAVFPADGGPGFGEGLVPV